MRLATVVLAVTEEFGSGGEERNTGPDRAVVRAASARGRSRSPAPRTGLEVSASRGPATDEPEHDTGSKHGDRDTQQGQPESRQIFHGRNLRHEHE